MLFSQRKQKIYSVWYDRNPNCFQFVSLVNVLRELRPSFLLLTWSNRCENSKISKCTAIFFYWDNFFHLIVGNHSKTHMKIGFTENSILMAWLSGISWFYCKQWYPTSSGTTSLTHMTHMTFISLCLYTSKTCLLGEGYCCLKRPEVTLLAIYQHNTFIWPEWACYFL